MKKTTEPAKSEATTLTLVIASIGEFWTVIDQSGDLAFLNILRYYFERAKRTAKSHDGRVLKKIGDGFIAVFAKAEDAIDFATEFIRSFVAHPSKKYPELANLHSRVVIHSGEMLFKKMPYGDDIFGDDVALCVRLEHRATSGQIIISNSAYSQLTPQKAAQFIGPEEHEVKPGSGKKTILTYWVLKTNK